MTTAWTDSGSTMAVSMGELSESQHDPASNYSSDGEKEGVIEPHNSKNTLLVTMFQTSLAMLKRELHADMREIEDQLRREFRQEIVQQCARLEREVTRQRTVKKASGAKSSRSGTSCTPRARPAMETMPAQRQTLPKGTTPAPVQLDAVSVDVAERLRGMPDAVQPKKPQTATQVDWTSVDVEQPLTHLVHSETQSARSVLLTDVASVGIEKHSMRTSDLSQSRSSQSAPSKASALTQSARSVLLTDAASADIEKNLMRISDLSRSPSSQSAPSAKASTLTYVSSGLTRIPEASRTTVAQSKLTRSRGFIRGSFFNVQHRAYDALKTLESDSSRLARILKCVHFSVMALLALLMSAFMSWGIFKVLKGTKYAEIHREEHGWVSGPMPLPLVGYNILNKNFSAKTRWCSIERGNMSTKHCQEFEGHHCKMGAGNRPMTCFPSGLRVIGTFGDPIYSYVGLHVLLDQTAPATTGEVNMEVAWDQYITQSTRVNMQQLYTGGSGRSIAHELFFQKVLSILGSPVGFAGRQGNDESEELLASDAVLSKAHEQTRLLHHVGDSRVLSVYFRASLTQREDFYEPYSLLRLLESFGGLWTSLTAIVASFTLTSAVAYARLTRCYRHCRSHVLAEIRGPALCCVHGE